LRGWGEVEENVDQTHHLCPNCRDFSEGVFQ
jgi:hypothetical protein